MWFLAQTEDVVNTSLEFTTTSDTASAGIFAGVMLVWFLVVLALFVVQVVALWKIFVKAGQEGWKSLIPIYNYWVLCEIVGKPGWWALVSLLMFIPFINFIAWIPALIIGIIVLLELGKAFGKDTVWSIFLLIIFSLIGLLILGFGDAKYTKPVVAGNGGAAPQV